MRKRTAPSNNVYGYTLGSSSSSSSSSIWLAYLKQVLHTAPLWNRKMKSRLPIGINWWGGPLEWMTENGQAKPPNMGFFFGWFGFYSPASESHAISSARQQTALIPLDVRGFNRTMYDCCSVFSRTKQVKKQVWNARLVALGGVYSKHIAIIIMWFS